MTVHRQCGAIGMKKDRSVVEAKTRFAAVIKMIEDFVGDHPEMIVGDGEFAFVFGPRERIQVVDDVLVKSSLQ